MIYMCPCCGFWGLNRPPYKQFPSAPIPRDLTVPYSKYFGEPSYEVCSCCGYEFGNDDEPGTAIGLTFFEFLEEWKGEGCPWFNPKKKPKDWNLDTQLRIAGIQDS